MPSRVRIVGAHPQYGVSYGGKVVHYILDSWMKRFIVKHPMFDKWPHWKRTLWMAKAEGYWMVKVVREVRKTKLSKSLYAKKAYEMGIQIPKKKKDQKKKVVDPRYKQAAVRQQERIHGAIDPVIQNVMYGVPPPINNVGNRAVNWGWVQQEQLGINEVPGGVRPPAIRQQDPAPQPPRRR